MSNENASQELVKENIDNLEIDEATDFDDLEQRLQSQLDQKLEELEFLEKEKAKIGNPSSLCDTIQGVVWEQFCNQIGVAAGEDFIKNNNGLNLDLSDEAHIQTAENFENGVLATHNTTSREQLEHNYERFHSTPHKEFRNEYVNPGMDATLERAGTLNKQGIETVTDIYTGRQIPTATKLEDGSNNPLAAQREHVKPSAELYKDPALQMGNGDQELADVINDPRNLQGYTTAERNIRKSDHSPDQMESYDKTKHWEEANEKAEKYIEEKREESQERLRQEGLESQQDEAFRIGGAALRAVVLQLFASLVKTILGKLVIWFKSANRKISTFVESVKEAIRSFVKNLKTHLVAATDTMLTAIATAIFGPVVSLIKKTWIFLKQGWKSLKEAIAYIKDPANKNKPIGILIAEVGKIIIAGLSAAGAIVMGEVISKALITIPIFAIEIPLLGSLASLTGILLGAIVSGVIGAIAINKIDKFVAERLKAKVSEKQIASSNEVIRTQEQLLEVVEGNMETVKHDAASKIVDRHKEATEIAVKITEKINKPDDNLEEIEKQNDKLKQMLEQL